MPWVFFVLRIALFYPLHFPFPIYQSQYIEFVELTKLDKCLVRGCEEDGKTVLNVRLYDFIKMVNLISVHFHSPFQLIQPY